MMRAWGNRPDTFVIDEPFYSFYLRVTGKKHPGVDEIIATGETDWRKVVEQCGRPLSVPRGKKIFYQKQMTHHLLPEIDREWLVGMANCFLIREPREVILSYIKKQGDPTLEDLGFVQQAEIFDFVRTRANSIPPIVDAKDVLENPERMLRLLCDAVGVEFSSACSVMQSVSSLAGQCFPGHVDCVKPTAFGRNIGTAKQQNRHRSSSIKREKELFPIVCVSFTSSAGNITSDFLNIACTETEN